MGLNAIALVYALVASAIGWGLLLTVGRGILTDEDRKRYLVVWFTLTVAMFLSPNGTVFLIIGFVLLIAFGRGGADPVATAAFLFAAAPPAGVVIEGLPGINYLLTFTFPMMASIVLLSPVAFRSLGRRMPGAKATDVFAFAYLALVFVLQFRAVTPTTGLRDNTILFFTALVPYLAFSKGIVTPAQLRRVVGSLLACLVIVAIIAFVGSVVRWQIYDVVTRQVFGEPPIPYLVRAGLLRTGGTLGASPISLGAMMVVALMLLGAFKDEVRGRWQLGVLVAACLLGLLASVSRGPMVGAAFGLLAYQLVKPNPVSSGMKATVAALAVGTPFALFTTTGRDLIELLPFVGSAESGSVTYRQDLVGAGWTVIQRNPLFGSATYLETEEMEAMRQGQGIIDIVNSYLTYALEFGLVGSGLFVLAILSAAWASLRAARRIAPDDPSGLRWVGAGLFAALMSYALTIATTSLVGLLEPLGWILIGANVAFARVATAAATASRGAGDADDAYEPSVSVDPADPAPYPDRVPELAAAPTGGPYAPTPAYAEPAQSEPAPARSSVGLQTPFDFVPHPASGGQERS